MSVDISHKALLASKNKKLVHNQIPMLLDGIKEFTKIYYKKPIGTESLPLFDNIFFNGGNQ